MNQRPTLTVAVVMEREAAPNRWQDWRHSVIDVLADTGQFGAERKPLRDDGKLAQTLFPGLAVTLFADEAEGYWLNVTSPQPAWFVRWSVHEDDPALASVEAVTLSYYEASRWMNGPEPVDTVLLPPDVLQWLSAFTQAHYKPEPRERKRPASFKRPEDRQ
jgi:hypothetical protein